MLPFKPEPFEELKRRFPIALEPLIDCTKGVPEVTPGEKREHVFDCEDGIRIIASRDQMLQNEIYYHFSCSAMHGTLLLARIKAGRLLPTVFQKMCEQRFSELLGFTVRQPDHYNYSQVKKVPHWFWREVYTNTENDQERNLA